MPEAGLHEEIKLLEERLEAKKRELAGSGEQKHEKEIFREVIKDAAASKPPAPLPQSQLADDDAKQKAYELQEKEHAEIIDSLVELALTKGLASAIKVAEAMKNPHILDEFHDTLADKYYEKLLESMKIR